MRFLSNQSTIVYFLCTSMLVMMMASATQRECKFRDYRMETFIGASANHCTPNEMKDMDETLDKVVYQIFPTIRGLEQADMTTCSLKGKYPSGGGRQLHMFYRRCTFCFDPSDACGKCHRRNLKQCRHQSWETIDGNNNNNMMRLTTTKNTLQKAINLSSRTTYVKVDLTLFQQQSNNNIIQVKIDGHSPLLLKYIENETSHFRKNGILSASQNYIRDGEGNLQYTKVVLHIDLSSSDSFEEEKELLLQFKMISTTEDEEDDDGESIIDDLVIKAANACAFKWSNQESSPMSEETTTAVTTLERETEWILSDKLTAVLNAISDADVNHCLNGRDPVVYVNLYKVSDHHEEDHLMC